jgi:hypothetical protein
MSAAQTLPREELLLGGARVGCSPLSLTKWRGHSSRTYIAGIYQPQDLDAVDLVGAVVIAVRRDGSGNSNGLAHPVRVALCPDVAAARSFLAVLPKAVSELHLHRTEPDAKERARIVTDLQPE